MLLAAALVASSADSLAALVTSDTNNSSDTRDASAGAHEPRKKARAGGTPVVQPTTAAPRQATTVTGKTPSKVKRPATLQVKTGGSWTSVAKTKTTTRGGYRFTTTAPATAGSVGWRVKAPKTVVRANGRTTTYPAFTSATTTTKVISPTPTPTPTVTPTATPTVVPTATLTATPTVTPTSTPTVTPTSTPTVTPTVTPPPDTTPPGVPNGLTATPANQSITLSWSPVTTTDLAGYTVYQATTSTGPWTAITSTQPATTKTVTGLINGTTYWYAVTATDTTGNQSARSTATNATPNNYAGPNHCGTLTSSETWTNNTVHILDCNLVVPTGLTLTINPGTIIKTKPNYGITVQGTLNATGTAQQPITFTSIKDDTAGGDTNADNTNTTPAKNDWGGISVDSHARATLTHATIAWATRGVYSNGADATVIRDSVVRDTGRDGIYVNVNRSGPDQGTSDVDISRNTLTNIGQGYVYGIYVWATGATVGTGTTVPVPTVADNTVTNASGPAMYVYGSALDGARLRGNNGTGSKYNQIQLAGTLTQDMNVPLGGLPIGFDYYPLTVAPNTTLTVAPGQVIKSYNTSGNDGALIVKGTLNATGTAQQPITFTSIKDDTAGGDTNADNTNTTPAKNDWGGISVDSHARATLTHATIAWATRGVYSNGADATVIRDSVVRDTGRDGIYVNVNRSGPDQGTSDVDISRNTLTNIGQGYVYGIYVWATGATVGTGTTVPVPTVADNTVTNASGPAMYVYGSALDGARLRGNNGTGSKYNQIQLAGTLTQDMNVPLGGLPIGFDYYPLTVAPNTTLTVAPGQVIKSYNTSGNDGALIVKGTLNATGTAQQPITFTSIKDDTAGGDTNADNTNTTPAKNDWGGISVDSHARATLTHATIAWATRGVYSNGADATVIRDSVVRDTGRDGIYVNVNRSGPDQGTSDVDISRNTLTNIGQGYVYGIYVWATGATVGTGTTVPVPTVADNTVTNASGPAMYVYGSALDGARLRGNNGTGSKYNQIQLAGTLTQDMNVPLGGLPIGFDYYPLTVAPNTTLTVAPPNTTLTVAPGQVIKSYNTSGNDGALIVKGTLNATGTAQQPITFTSIKDDTAGGDTNADNTNTTPAKNDWGGISVDSHARATLTHATIAWATRGVYSNGADATVIRDSVVRDTGRDGIYVNVNRSGPDQGTSDVDISRNTLTNIGQGYVYGIYVWATGATVGTGTTVPVPTVADNTVTNASGPAMYVYGSALDGARLRGNNGTGSKYNQIQLAGTLTQDMNVPLGGLPIGFDYYPLTVAPNTTLTVAPGQVIKSYNTSGNDGALIVKGTLNATGTAQQPITFTSIKDDTAGGDTNADNTNTTPAKNDWGGISVEGSTAVPANATMLNVSLRYAQTALSVSRNASASVSGSVVTSTVGVESDGSFVNARDVDWGSTTGPSPEGTGVPVQGSGVVYVPWVGYVPPPRPVLAPSQPVPSDTGTTCRTVTIFGLRGSGESPVAAWLGFGNWQTPTFSGEQDGFGSNAWDVRYGFVNRLSELNPGATTKSVAIQYLGLPVPGTTLPSPGMTSYTNSIYDGVDKLIQRMYAECNQTQFVLTGYSQGALSIHLALRQLAISDPSMLNRVAGVGLVADPGRTINGGETVWGGANQPASWLVGGSAGVQASFLVGDSSLSGPLPNAVTPRTISLCHDWDMVCGIYPLARVGPHTTYNSTETNAAGRWIAERVAPRL